MLLIASDCFWNTGLQVPTHEGRAQLLSDITSLQNEPLGWNAIVAPYLNPARDLRLEHDSADGNVDGSRMALSLMLASYPNYNITAPETIRIMISGPPVLTTVALRVFSYFVIGATVGRAEISGALDEASVRGGVSHQLRVDLEDAEVAPYLFNYGDGPMQVIESLGAVASSDPSHVDFVARPLSGFDHVLRDSMVASSVANLGDSVLTITVPPNAAFSILAPETVRLTLPAAAVSTRLVSPVVGTVIVNATPGNATLIGGLAATPSEDYVRTADAQFVDVELEEDYWTPLTLLEGPQCSRTTQRSSGTCFLTQDARVRLYAAGGEPHGWDAIVGGRVLEASVESNQTLRLYLPRSPAYQITAPEPIHVEVPPLAVLSRQTVHASEALVIRALSGEARLGGTLLFATTVGPRINVSESYTVDLEALDTSAVWLHDEAAIAGSDASNVVLGAIAAQQPGLFNASLLGEAAVLNASHLVARALRTNITLRYVLPVPADFYSLPVENATFRLSGVAFESNRSTLVKMSSTWNMHVEEIPTGVVEQHNYEASLRVPAPSHLATDGWTPNLLAQALSLPPSSPLGHTLEIELLGDTWVTNLGEEADASTAALLGALRSEQQEERGWNFVVLAALTPSAVRRASDTLVVITLPISANYSTVRPETITITLPSATVRSAAPIDVSSAVSMPPWARWAAVDVHPIVLKPDVGIVAMQTALSNETDLQTLGLTTTVALTLEGVGDTWVAEVGVAGHPINAELVRGFSSTSTESSSWSSIARETLAFLATSTGIVTRVSDAEVHVAVPYLSGYEIEFPDNITLVVPGAAVLTNRTTLGSNWFTIMPTPGNCTLEGTLLAAASVASLRTSALTLRLRLVGDRFRAGAGAASGLDDADARALLGSIRSEQDEPAGWNAIIRPGLLSGALAGRVARLKRNLVEISLPSNADYALSAPETLTVELPGSVLQSQRDLEVAVVASPPLIIRTSPTTPIAHVTAPDGAGGTRVLVGALEEADVRAPFTLHLRLADDTWSTELGTSEAATAPLLQAVRSLQDEPAGFNAAVKPALTWQNVSVPAGYNRTELRIAFSGAARFNIGTPEAIVLVLPASALASGQALRSPDLLVRAEAGTLGIGGSMIVGKVTDVGVRSPEATLDLLFLLEGDAFVSSLGLAGAASEAFLNAIQSSDELGSHEGSGAPSANEHGWVTVVRPLLGFRHLLRLNESAVRLRVPAAPAYRLATAEALVLNLNATAEGYFPVTTSEQGYLVGLPTVHPASTPPLARLHGAFFEAMTAPLLRRDPAAIEAAVLNVSLCCNLTFVLPMDNWTRLELVHGLRSSVADPEQPSGWNAKIRDGLSVLTLTETELAVVVPPSPTYFIRAIETIVFDLPSHLLNTTRAPAAMMDAVAAQAASLGALRADPLLLIEPSDATAAAAPAAPPLQLQEDGLPRLFVRDDQWTPNLVRQVPAPAGLFGPNALTAKDLREAPMGLNLTLHLRQGFGDAQVVTDTWDADAISAAVLVAGFVSDQQQPNGWDEIVRYGPPPTVTAVNESLTIHWPEGQFVQYNPRAPETIELHLPAVAVRSAQPLTVGRFVVSVEPGTVAMSGALLHDAEEADLRSLASHTLTMKLTGGTWLPTVGLEGAASSALLGGLRSAQDEAQGWNGAIQPLLTSVELARLDDTTVEVTIPQRAGYDIASPETITLTVPPEATHAAQALTASEVITILPMAGSGRCAGNLMTAGNDASVQAVGALTLELRLTDESWVEPLTDEVLGALLGGIRSQQYEVGGWNAIIGPKLLAHIASTNITRVSDTLLSIEVDSTASYDISTPETITVSVPSIAVLSRRGIDFRLPFLVYPATPRATLSAAAGSLSVPEAFLQDPSLQERSPRDFTLGVTLSGAVWSPHLGAVTAVGVQATAAMLEGLRPTTYLETSGWLATVSPRFVVSDLTVLSPTSLNISVRQAAAYRLVASESVQLTVPAAALQYGLGATLATPQLVVRPSGASAELAGSLLYGGGNSEESIRTRESTLTITLFGADWGPFTQIEDGGNGPTSDLLAGIRSAQDEPNGFNSLIKPQLIPRRVQLSLDRRTIVITIPPVPAYSVSRPETITVTLPGGDPTRNSRMWTILYEQPLVARPTVRIDPSAGSATLSGEPITAGVNERWLASTRPIVFDVTLSGDTFVASVGEEDFGLGATSALAAGIASTSDHLTGFNKVIQPTLGAANIERVSDTRVTITIREFYDYDIDAPETVLVTVPAAALMAGMPILAEHELVLRPVHSAVAISGDFALSYANTSSEVAVRVGLEPSLLITLISDTWVQALGREHDADGPSMRLLNGLVSQQASPTGWMNIVRHKLTPEAVRYLDPGNILITLPQVPDYDIDAPETIVFSIPAAAMRNNPSDVPAAASFVVLAARGAAEIGGSVLADVSEADIASSSTIIEVLLHHDTFANNANLCDGDVQSVLSLAVAPLDTEWCWPLADWPNAEAPPPPPPGTARCSTHQENGWASVLSELPCSGIRRLDERRLRLTLPPFPAYDITIAETISVTVNAFALTSNRSTLARPAFDVHPTAGTAHCTGSLVDANERGLRAGGLVLDVTLIGAQWRPSLDVAARLAVLRGLSSSNREAHGWDLAVLPHLDGSELAQLDQQRVRITLPPYEGYDLRTAETLTLRVPAVALLSSRAIEASPLLVITATPGHANYSGFVDYDRSERAVRSGRSSQWSVEQNALLSEPMALTITLVDDEWSADLGSELHVATQYFLQALLSAQSEPDGWNRRVQPALEPRHLFRQSARVLRIELPARANYGIRAPETLSIVIPPLALASNSTGLGAPPIGLEAEGGLAHASGSLLVHLHEEDVRSTELTLNLTLTRDEWVHDLEQKYAHDLLDGIGAVRDANDEEPGAADARLAAGDSGFDQAVRPRLYPRHVTRVDATTVVISLDGPSYDISVPETIAITIPREAVLSNQPLPVRLRLVVLPEPGVATILSGGSLLEHADEAALRSAQSHTLQVLLANDTFRAAATQYDTGAGAFSQLRQSLRVSEHEWYGFNRVVNPTLEHPLWRLSNGSTLITLTIPQVPEYDITAPESLRLSIPPEALASRQRVLATGAVRIDPTRGVAELWHQSGLLRNCSESAIASATPLTVHVRLRGDEFVPSVGANSEATSALLAGFTSAQHGATGWNAVVLAGLDFRRLTRVSSTELAIDLRQHAQYAVAEPETITLLIPQLAVRSDLPIVAAPSVVVRATPGRAVLGGSLLAAPPSERAVREGGHTLRITIVDDAWSAATRRAATDAAADDAAASAASRDVLDQIVTAMLSQGAEADGWNVRVRDALRGRNATLEAGEDGTPEATLVFVLPPVPNFRIGSPETLVVRLPPAAIASAAPIVASPPLVIRANSRRARFGGHLFEHAHEAVLQSDVSTNLTLILTDDVWAPVVGLPHLGATERALSQALLEGIISCQSEPAGWHAVLRRALRPEDVQRIDDATLAITLPPAADYAIVAPETLVFAVPPDALLSRAPIELDAPLVVRPSAGRARLSGSFLIEPSEEAVRSSGTLEIAISLVGDSWVSAVGRQEPGLDDEIARALLDGLTPLGGANSEPSGWAAIVQPGLGQAQVARAGPQTVVIRLPPFLRYDIAAPETVEVRIPAVALVSGEAVTATPRLRVLASNGTLQATGSLLSAPTEEAITQSAEAPTILLTLLQDAWAEGLGVTHVGNGTEVHAAEAAARALIANLRSQQDQPHGWSRVIQPALTPSHLTRLSNQTMQITLPAARGAYDIYAPETIVMTAPEEALVSGRHVVARPPVVLTPTPGTALLSNSLVSNNSETDVQGGGMQITVTLVGDTWASGVGQRGDGTEASLTEQVLDAFISAQSEDNGWNQVVRDSLAYTDLSYVEGAAVTLTLPSFPAYNLLRAETISVNLPSSAVVSGQSTFAGIGAGSSALQISANTGTIRLSGSLFGAANETSLRSVTSYQIIITLTGDSWTQGVGQQDETGEGASAQLLRGLTSLQSEQNGWNSIVRPGIPQRNVERTTDFIVTITIDQFAAYDVTEPETIEVVVPPIAVSSAQVVQAPSFVVFPIKGRASVSGRLVEQPSEDVLCCTSGLQLVLTLTDDTWASGVGAEPGVSSALSAGLLALQDEDAGWNAVVKPALIAASSSAVTRVSDTEVVIAFPPLPAYQIRHPETLVVSIPASTVSSKQRLSAEPARGIIISAAPPAALLGGLLYPSAEEAQLRVAAGNTLSITLLGDRFLSRVALPGAASTALLDGLFSSDERPDGWNAIVRPQLTYASVAWDYANASSVVVTIPQAYRYDVREPETISVVVPSSAVESGRRASRPATFVLLAAEPVIRLSGDLLDRATDEGVRADHVSTLALTLEDDAWYPTVGLRNEMTDRLVQGIAPSGPATAPPSPPPSSAAVNASSAAVLARLRPFLQRHPFVSSVLPELSSLDVARVSNTTIRLSLPPTPRYRPQEPETLSLTVPAEALRSGRTTLAESPIVLSASSASARLSGPLLDAPHEGVLHRFATNLTVVLSGTSFVKAFAPHQELALLAGLRAIGGDASASGFNAQYTAALEEANVSLVRVSAQELRLHLPPLRGLRLSAPETVTLTVPAFATELGARLAGALGAADVVCNPALVLRPRRALLSGTLVGNVDERAIRTVDHTLHISLYADEFVESVGDATSAATLALIDGVGSALASNLAGADVKRLSATHARLTVRYVLQQSYAIATPETVVVTLPALAIKSAIAFRVAPAFTIGAVTGDVATPGMGSATWYHVSESQLAGTTIRLTADDIRETVSDYETFVDLVGDEWVAGVGDDSDATTALLQGLISRQSEASSWNAIVRPSLRASAVRRVTSRRVEITLSGHVNYALIEPETLSLVVPAAALVSGRPRLAAGPTFVVAPQRGRAALSGSLLVEPYERQVQSVEGGRIVVTLLEGERWVPTLGQTVDQDDACTASMIDRLTLESGATQAFGWENVVQVALRERLDSVLVRESYTTLAVQLPQLLIYKLDQGAERITAAIPPACVLSGNELRAADGHITNAPFSVLPAVGRAYVSGTLLNDAREVTVQTAYSQLQVRLFDDIFVGDEAGIPAILYGSLGDAAGAWASVVRPSLSAADVSIGCAMNGEAIACSSEDVIASSLETTITINFDPNAGYQIDSPETISIAIPDSMLASRQTILASPPFVIQVAGAQGLAAYGSVITSGGIDEAELQGGGLQNLTIQLVGDTFGANAAGSVLQGLVSAQDEALGWSAAFRPSLSVDHFSLLANTTLALYFRGVPGYDVASPETIAIEVPAAAVSSGQVPPAVPTFTVTAAAGVAAFSSEGVGDGMALLNASNELAIAGPRTQQVVLQLYGNTFRADVGRDKWASEAVLASFYARQTDAEGGGAEGGAESGWNAVVRPLLGRSARYLTRLSDSACLLVLPQAGTYSIEQPETLDVRLPDYLVSSGRNLTSTGLLVVQPRAGEGFISGGTLGQRVVESAVRSSATTIELSLLDDTFSPRLTQSTAANATYNESAARELLGAIVSLQDDEGGWNAIVRPLLLSHGTLVREAARRLTITVPRAHNYSIARPEVVVLAIPASAVVSRVAPLMVLPRLEIRPERGTASLGTALRTESDVRQGDLGEGEMPPLVSTLAADALHDTATAMAAVTLNITLEEDEWDDALLQYVDETYEVCVYPPPPNATLAVNLTNLTMCMPSLRANNNSNATCAFVGNSTNASIASTWAWGYPWRLETYVDGRSGLPLATPSWAYVAIGGADWRAARVEGFEATEEVARRHGGPVYANLEEVERALGPLAVTFDAERTMVPPPELLSEAEARVGGALGGAERRLSGGDADATNSSNHSAASAASSYNASLLVPNSTGANASGTNLTVRGPCTTYVRRIYSEATTKLLGGIVSARLEAKGWMREVQPRLTGDLLRRNGSTVTLTLPPLPQYNLDAPEELSVKIPREALRSGRPLTVNATASIAALGGRVSVAGSFAATPVEEALQSPRLYELVFTLEDEKWDETVGLDGSVASRALLELGLTPMQSEPFGFSAVVQPQLTARHLTRHDDSTVTLSLPAFPSYSITQPETIVFVVPPAAVASRQTVAANASLVIMPSPGFVTLNGSLIDELSEGYIVGDPALLLDVTLYGDTWEPNVTVFNSSLMNTLIEGFSALTPRIVQLGEKLYFGNVTLETNYSIQTYRYTGWDDQARPALQVAALDERTLRFTLPPVPEYDIFEVEVVQLSLAPELVNSRNPPLVRPLLRVQPASAAAYGSLLTYGSRGEYAVQNHSTASRAPLADPPMLVLVLRGDRWHESVGLDSNATRQLLERITPFQNESRGWQQVVRPVLTHEHVRRDSDAVVRLVLPRFPEYDISVPETLGIVVPGVAVASGQDLYVPYNVTLFPTPGSFYLSGGMVEAASEADVRERELNRTIVLNLVDDEWDEVIGAGRAGRSFLFPDEAPIPSIATALVESLRSRGEHAPGGLDELLEGNRTRLRVRVPSSTELEIELPLTPNYDIVRPETITLVVPPDAVKSRGSPTLQRPWVILPSVGVPSVRSAPDAPLLLDVEEVQLQANGTVFVFHIESDGFVEEVGKDSTESVALIDGITSQQSEPAGWNAIVRPTLTYRSLTRSADGTVVTMVVPAYPHYNVRGPETLTLQLEASVLLSGQPITMGQTIEILATSGYATTSGTLSRQGGGNAPAQPCCNREDYLQRSLAERGGASEAQPTLTITLTDDLWEPGVEFPGSVPLQALTAGIQSSTAEERGWNRQVVWALTYAADIEMKSVIGYRDTLTFTLPPLPYFQIYVPEVITLTVPAAAVVSRNEILAQPQLLVRATPGTLSVNGTIVDTPVESTLQYGTSTLLINAFGDRWVDAFADPFSVEGRYAAETLVRGLCAGSCGTNISSWNRAVTPALLGLSEATNFTFVTITRLTNETLEVALPRVPGYDVLVPEAVDLIVEPSLLMSNTTLTLPTALIIVPTAGSAQLRGNALANLTEFQITFNRTVEDLRIEIMLDADSWTEPLLPNMLEGILAGIVSSGTEKYGWNNVVRRALTPAMTQKVSEFELHVYVPFLFEEYRITVPETITATIPVGALTSNQTIVATPSIRIQAMPGYATITGPITGTNETNIVESRLREDAISFNLTLRNETWLEGVGESDTYEHRLLSHRLIGGLTATGRWGVEATAWENVVRPAMLAANPLPLSRPDDYTIVFEVPASRFYDIEAPETLTIQIPPDIVLAEAPITAEPYVPIEAIPGTASLVGSLVCDVRGYYTSYTVPSPPPPLPPPFVDNPFLSPPPDLPPPPPPHAPGSVPPPPECNNTERAIRDDLVHDLTIRLANDSWIPILDATKGIPGGEVDQLLAGLVASSWLHGSLNVSEQEGHPLLSNGWNLVVQPALRVLPPPPPPPLPPEYFSVGGDTTPSEQLYVDDRQTVRIHFGPMPAYSSWVPETLTVTLPDTTILSHHTLVAAPPLILWAEPGSLVPRGAIVDDHYETTLQLSATTLELTLVGDRWAPEVAHIGCDSCPDGGIPGSVPHGPRVMTPERPPPGCPCLAGDESAYYVDHHANASFQLLEALIARSDRLEPGSFNYVMRPRLLERRRFRPVLWRVDDFTLNLTMPQTIEYDIESPETLTLVTPRESVLSDQPIAMPPIVVFPIAGGILVNGTLLDGVDENTMRDRGPGEYLTLILTLTNDTWVENLGSQAGAAANAALGAGLTADALNTNTCQEQLSDDPGICIKGGWMDIVQPILTGPQAYLFLDRFTDTTLRIIIPSFPGCNPPVPDCRTPAYDIFAPDLVNIYIPPQVVFSNQLIVAPTQIRIEATQGLLYITGGSLVADNTEAAMQRDLALDDPNFVQLTITLLLQRDSWIPTLGTAAAYLQGQALLRGLRQRADANGRPPEPNGWESVVLPELLARCNELSCSAIERVNSEVLIINVPAVSAHCPHAA